MQDIPGWLPTALLWGGIATIALSSSPGAMAVGAVLCAAGMSQASEAEARRRIDALEKHFLSRIEHLERNAYRTEERSE